jgi:hypothetical protein
MKQMWLEDAGTSADPRDTRIVCDCGAGEAYAFENSCETLPRTPLDLQRLLLARLSDLQHSLLHDDFAQGPTVCSLTSERAGQNWMADHLRRSQGRSYSIKREPHVVGEKEPDIRARSKANDASMPIEIKVAESWPLDKLEEALVDQLCGRYLRASYTLRPIRTSAIFMTSKITATDQPISSRPLSDMIGPIKRHPSPATTSP